MLKLIASLNKKHPVHPNEQDSDTETENISVARTLTPIKIIATRSKTTPNNSRNMVTGVLNDTTNHPIKKPKQPRSQNDY